ncbi:MAG TPA: glycerophosphodiester phosphodiesterase family protein, partial [Acidimicrobiia bacterium]|nr:glycerophosphodiester phosphodiesterase family protein [Acidimicrobiia bacterium]
DLYAEVGTRFDLSIDLKVPGAAGSILHVARTAGDPSALWLCSRDADLLRRLRSEDPDVRLVQSLGRRRGGGGLERLAAGLARDGIRALNLHESDCSLGVVSLVHRFGLLAFAWDAQEARRIRAVLGMGVDGIYSDHVERMVATVGEWSVGPG